MSLSQDRINQKLYIRKKKLNEILFTKRKISSSKKDQSEKIEEEKEEHLLTGVKNYPLHQHKKYYWIKKKKKRWCVKPGTISKQIVPN